MIVHNGDENGSKDEEKLLASAYLNSLSLATNYKELYPSQCLALLDEYIEGLHEDERISLVDEVREEVMEYVNEHTIKTIAFPSISTGIYRFPLEKAAKIAIGTIREFLFEHNEIEKVVIVCFDKTTYECYYNEINNY